MKISLYPRPWRGFPGLVQVEAFGWRFGIVWRGWFQRPPRTPVRLVWVWHPFLYRMRDEDGE